MIVPQFVDEVDASVNILNDLLQTHMPLAVDYTIGQVGYTLQLKDLKVKVNNQNGISVMVTSDTMFRKRLDPLRVALGGILRATIEEPSWSAMTFGVMLLQMSEEALFYQEEWTADQDLLLVKAKEQDALKTANAAGWEAASSDWTSILSNPIGVNLLTVNDTAKFLLGQSITDILRDSLPKSLRVLHVEAVFRDDLVQKFARMRQKLRTHFRGLSYDELKRFINKDQLKQLRRGKSELDSVEDLAEMLSTPTVTFHGAPRHVIKSIVRYGFVVPGRKIGDTDVENEIACGASFGIGIYSSPDIFYATKYAGTGVVGRRRGWQHPADVPGLRIVVCATLMGRPIRVSREETRRTTGLFCDQGDSHVGRGGAEYVVFDSAQIIPCYVLHLDYGSERARLHFDTLASNPGYWTGAKLKSRLDVKIRGDPKTSAEAKLAKKAALKAAASKWFPYGFGPATGSSFVIEEIADVSDDEEDQGEFREFQMDDEDPRAQPVRFAEEKKSWFDEFQTVRRTKNQVRI